MKRFCAVACAAAVCAAVCGEDFYDIGRAMDDEAFWNGDPVLFVTRHKEQRFAFTSSSRECAVSSERGLVTFHGVPLYETRVYFTEDGRGVSHVELSVFNKGDSGARRRVTSRGVVEQAAMPLDRAGFAGRVKALREALAVPGAKEPEMKTTPLRAQGFTQKSQTWPRSGIPTQATLTWNYYQKGRDETTFKPEFIRVAVAGPARLAADAAARKASGGKTAAKDRKKIADNVVRDPRGDVFIDNVPMVDQGQKGYCAVATAERVMRYYGLDVDEHELAQAAGSSADGGTSTRATKESVETIGRKYKLATVVTYGDFERPAGERIAGIVKEVANYNKAAKKLKKPEIPEDAYVTHRGSVTTYSPADADRLMDPEVLREMKVNGAQKSRFKKFTADIHQQIDRGIPLFWGVTLGIYPEPEIPQSAGGHMRLIIGYNDKKREILYSDSWGAGHELKRMPAEWAWTISRCLMYMKPAQ